ncbi:predicted protein [Chaetomium globosum CBS 148.51]|uniref:Uncharacterized protein n=1 Tax=Chaetomium globosum (strain ATCC 6205 / CBS 148.51 / DSM 1962 / NBRC 6347 / NRRL 1970) TaxID=306901 RepID=Q2GTR2_CHAGB|nr:uncharacterized protein CHGG_08642 [Chaetomium globosum CBS 148.51]EAQ84628.1 predicted protein [Chaetomium globosum CBS 148.51]
MPVIGLFGAGAQGSRNGGKGVMEGPVPWVCPGMQSGPRWEGGGMTAAPCCLSAASLLAGDPRHVPMQARHRVLPPAVAVAAGRFRTCGRSSSSNVLMAVADAGIRGERWANESAVMGL